LIAAAEGTVRSEIGVPNADETSGEIGTKTMHNPVRAAKTQQN
jgi:hypothetical protein